jgi:hypothetical protein
MQLPDFIIYYYLIGKQKIVNWYNSLIVYFLGYKECLMFTSDGLKQNISFRLLLYILLNKLSNYIAKLKNNIDIRADKIHITKMTYEGEKTIIIDKNMMVNQDTIIFDNILDQLNNAKPDDTLSEHIILNLELINDENNKTCLKNFILKYKDKEEQYHHTLQNILIFNNISYNDDSSVEIKLIKDRKIVSKVIPIKEIHDKHINYIMNFG